MPNKPEPPPDDDRERMTPEEALAFMDEWVKTQNEIVAHNYKVFSARLRAHAERRGLDWRELSLDELRRILDDDANRGAHVVEGAAIGGLAKAGKRKGPPERDDELRAFVRKYSPARRGPSVGSVSWTEACRLAGRRFGLHRRTVQRRIPDTRW